MNAKSAFDKYLSSHTFCATNNELKSKGLQFVGFNVNPVNAMSRLI